MYYNPNNGDDYKRIEKSKITKRNRSRTENFTSEEKKKVAILVKEKDYIWNYENILHRNAKAIDEGWDEIATELGKTKDECKRAFTHLREGFRYREKMAKIMFEKGEIDDPKDLIFADDYEFREELAFLHNLKRPRQRNFITQIEDDICNEDVQDESTTNSYCVKEEQPHVLDPIDTDNLQSVNKKRCIANSNKDFIVDNIEEVTEYALEIDDNQEPLAKKVLQSDDLVYQLSKLVDGQTKLLREFNGTGKLAYKTQLTAVDALLQQLPKSLAKKTLVEMQNYVLKKVNEHQKDQTDSE